MSNELVTMEQAVLGALLDHPDQIQAVLGRLPPDQWTGPHQLITECLLVMSDAGEPVTAATVMERMNRMGTLIRAGGGAVLLGLSQARAAGGMIEADFLIAALEEQAQRRAGKMIGQRLIQALDNPTVEPNEALERAQDQISMVGRTQGAVEFLGWPDGDLDPEPNWVIPGLLATDERVMLTGGEGLGKSMLIRQLVTAVAVGRHPWSFVEFEPGIALHVDLENPRYVTDSAYRRIRNGLRFSKVQVGNHLHRLEPRIFDVCNPRDVSWLLRAVNSLQPSIIAIGPLKNMSSENLNDEDAAVRVTNVLNRVRAESGATLIVEAHAGHGSRGEDGDWRPRGSSSFLGWPEVGLGMRPISKPPVRAAQLVGWRGTRTPGRYWPEYLAEGDCWPWVEDPRVA